MRPAVFGTVASVSGNIIMVNGRQGFGTTSPTTVFTVDATNATVMKNNATSSISNIVVGDTVLVQGTVSGTNVIATKIRDGVVMTRKPGGPNGSGNNNPGQTPMTPPIQGNGQPVVAGTVTSVSGDIISITNKSNAAYTIDATNAKIVQGQNTIAIGNVAVGNTVLVQGTVSGSSVVASTVIDQGRPATPGANPGATNGGATNQPNHGFFGSIGQFFMKLFGF